MSFEPSGVRIRIQGTVQGVGFRPTVYKIAKSLKVKGEVKNSGEGVLIYANLTGAKLDEFIKKIKSKCPALAKLENIELKIVDDLPQYTDFKITSSQESFINTAVSPDAAICDMCLAEIQDKTDRHFNYAFTNCTNCGPRLSIIKALPYDRKNTSMREFKMCNECKSEYESPLDRRFHAEPVACPACGPKLWFTDNKGIKLAGDAIELAATELNAGKIVAVKGIGGFHLAVIADKTESIMRLRRRKNRLAKPLAVMARDLDAIDEFAELNTKSAKLLNSNMAPIVLLKKKPGTLSSKVAPNNKYVGVMLPYTALHHMLLAKTLAPLVMTSGNLSGELQVIDNAKAISDLGKIADFILLHDREIINRVDDSLLRIVDDKIYMLRLGRGFAPRSLKFKTETNRDILAMGGELKNSFAFTKNNQVTLSQHIGDLEEFLTFADYKKKLKLYQKLYAYKPKIIAVDKHPEYLSSKLGRQIAKDQGLKLIEVQHHHAHAAACMLDNEFYPEEQVLAIVLDGLGFGDDGTLWGGEFLSANLKTCTRLARFKPVPLIGGTKALLEPWRNLYAQLKANDLWQKAVDKYSDVLAIKKLKQKDLKTVNAMLKARINVPQTSACGRIFDAAAALLGYSFDNISYEAQAAIELENAVKQSLEMSPQYPYEIITSTIHEIDLTATWLGMLDDIKAGKPDLEIAAGFHKTIGMICVELAVNLSKNHTVVLSGGVFQNILLLNFVRESLIQQGFKVLTHKNIPANDGGLALGQLIIAANNIK